MSKKNNRFQKYKEIKDLDLFKKYDAEKKGVYFSASNIRRYFCECGSVGTYNKYMHPVCEECGNKEFLFLGELFRWGTGFKGTRLERVTTEGSDPLIVYTHRLKAEVDANEETIRLVETKQEEMRVEDGQVIGRPIYYQIVFDDIKSKSPAYLKIKDAFETLKDNNTKALLEMLTLAHKHPHVKIKDFVKHKAVYRYINNREPSLWETLTDFNSFLIEKNIDKKLVPIIDKIFDQFYYWYSYDEVFHNFAKLDEEHKDLILNALDQSLISINNMNGFLNDFRNCKSMPGFKQVEKYFNSFLKENIVVYSSAVIREFRKRVNFLKDNDIEINEYTLKTKQYKLARNYVELSVVHGIPKEKVDIFIDLIDENPLKAIKFIKDRRKLTKKQIEEILAMQED